MTEQIEVAATPRPAEPRRPLLFPAGLSGMYAGPFRWLAEGVGLLALFLIAAALNMPIAALALGILSVACLLVAMHGISETAERTADAIPAAPEAAASGTVPAGGRA